MFGEPNMAHVESHMAAGQKSGNPKMVCPGKWKHGLKPAVPWLLNFDPYPHACMRVCVYACMRVCVYVCVCLFYETPEMVGVPFGSK